VQYSRFNFAMSSAARLPWHRFGRIALGADLRVGFLGDVNSWRAVPGSGAPATGLVLLRGVAQELASACGNAAW